MTRNRVVPWALSCSVLLSIGACADDVSPSIADGSTSSSGDTATPPPDDDPSGESTAAEPPPPPPGEPGCGDDMVSFDEQCDGDDLQGESCQSLGWDDADGALACDDECRFDTSSCGPPPVCGDGMAQGDEECDGSDLDGYSCADFGWEFVEAGGTLGCNDNCTHDTSGCYFCGDGKLQPGEVCDGSEFADSCESLGYGPGTLTCDGCTAVGVDDCCGDGVIGPRQDCEGDDLGGESCESLGFAGGELSCSDECGFDTSECIPKPTCGDGVIEAPEECEGDDLAGQTCASLTGALSGELSCHPTSCMFVTDDCDLFCGNGVIDKGEQCDGAPAPDASCIALGYAGGETGCNDACEVDASSGIELSPGQLVITEVQTTGVDWFELHNPGAVELPIGGCEVGGYFAFETVAIGGDAAVPAGGSIVIAAADDPSEIGAEPDVVLPGALSLTPSLDAVRLSCSGVVIDEVAYNDETPWPSSIGAETSLNLDAGSLDAAANDDGAAWCALAPSPGEPDPVCP